MSSKALLLGLAAGAAALAGVAYLLTRTPPSASAARAGAASSVRPDVDKQKLIRIFSMITNMMQQVVMNLSEVEQQLRAQA
jgi:hypothetical protein